MSSLVPGPPWWNTKDTMGYNTHNTLQYLVGYNTKQISQLVAPFNCARVPQGTIWLHWEWLLLSYTLPLFPMFSTKSTTSTLLLDCSRPQGDSLAWIIIWVREKNEKGCILNQLNSELQLHEEMTVLKYSEPQFGLCNGEPKSGLVSLWRNSAILCVTYVKFGLRIGGQRP